MAIPEVIELVASLRRNVGIPRIKQMIYSNKMAPWKKGVAYRKENKGNLIIIYRPR